MALTHTDTHTHTPNLPQQVNHGRLDQKRQRTTRALLDARNLLQHEVDSEEAAKEEEGVDLR